MKKALTLAAFALGTFAAGAQANLVKSNMNCKGATFLMMQDDVASLSDCTDLCTAEADCEFYMYREATEKMGSKCKLLSETCAKIKGGAFDLYEAEEATQAPAPKCGRHRNKKLCTKKGKPEGCVWNNKAKKMRRKGNRFTYECSHSKGNNKSSYHESLFRS
jgi:hypothetical protein